MAIKFDSKKEAVQTPSTNKHMPLIFVKYIYLILAILNLSLNLFHYVGFFEVVEASIYFF